MGLRSDKVSVRFGGVAALQEISLALEHGEILGLIGPNGAGKTTMVNVLSGFQRAHIGSIELDGRPVQKLGAHAFACAGVVRTFQAVRLFANLSVSENVEVACVSAGLGRRAARMQAAEMLDYLGIGDRAHTLANALNYGDERRVGLARALALRPRYLLLDEPAAGLNGGEAEQLRVLIGDIRRTFGCGVLVIEHNMSLIRALCDRVHVLTSGRSLFSGSPGDVFANQQVRQAYLGSHAA